MSAISLDKARVHQIATPEGLSLPFVVAPAGDRVSAFLLDLLAITGATVAVWVLAALSAAAGLGEVGISFALVAGFLLWNFYFIHFEIRWGGVTPGKRRAGLRVISRGGGPLTAEAIFARNLMRNLEFYVPVMALLSPGGLVPSAPGWGRLLAVIWVLVFALMPLFNHDRLRCGDLVAGTLVVKAPAAVLLSDLADRGIPRASAPRKAPPGQAAPPSRSAAARAVPLHPRAARHLRHPRAAGAGGPPATGRPGDARRPHPRRGLREDQGQDQLAAGELAGAGAPVPGGLLPRPAGPTGAEDAVRAAAGAEAEVGPPSPHPRFTTTTVRSSGASLVPEVPPAVVEEGVHDLQGGTVGHYPQDLAGAVEAVGVAAPVQALEDAIGAEDEDAAGGQMEGTVPVRAGGAAPQGQAGQVDLAPPYGPRSAGDRDGRRWTARLRPWPGRGRTRARLVKLCVGAHAAHHPVELLEHPRRRLPGLDQAQQAGLHHGLSTAQE